MVAVMAVINPLGWLIYSLGLVRRSLKISLVFAPTMILGCMLGLPYGAAGVAFAYSAVMVLWVVPLVAVVRARHGDFRPRYRGGGDPAAGLWRHGGSGRLRRAADVRRLPFAVAEACPGVRRAGRDVLCCCWSSWPGRRRSMSISCAG